MPSAGGPLLGPNEVQAVPRGRPSRSRSGNQGVILGIFGCCFGLLGIVTLGLVFVPLAILFSLFGLLRGVGRSIAGAGISLVGLTLSVIGFCMSPSLLLLAGGIVAVSQTGKDALPEAEQQAAKPNFDFRTGDEALPKSGARAWCNRSDVQENILAAFDGTDAIKNAQLHVLGFESAKTVAFSFNDRSASCHGIVKLSNGQTLPGIFSIRYSRWEWMND
jgi:hypothetical protein